MTPSRLLAALAALLLSAPAGAAGAADAISAVDPYVRQPPPGALATAAFMVLKNAGGKEVRLVKAENPATKSTELHTHLHENGVMKMRQVPEIPIKAGGEAALQPGGYHIMMIEPKAALKVGDAVPITLTFDDGSSRVVSAPVRAPGAMPMPPTMEHKH